MRWKGLLGVGLGFFGGFRGDFDFGSGKFVI